MPYAIAGAAIAAVGGIAASSISAGAAEDAANAQSASAKSAQDVQQQQYNQQRADQAPWRTIGGSALNSLATRLGIAPYSSTPAPVVQDINTIRANLQKQYGTTTTPNGSNGQSYITGQDGNVVPVQSGSTPGSFYLDNPNTFLNSNGVTGSTQQGADPSSIEAAAQAQYQQQQQALNDYNSQQDAYKNDPTYGSLLQQSPAFKQFTNADFVKDPGYDFRLQQGLNGLESTAASRGGLLSGAALKAANKYNQDYASNEFQNAYSRFNTDQTNNYNRFQTDQTNQYNRLASLAGVGQTSNSQLAPVGENYANQTSSALTAAGNAQASGYNGRANAIGSGLGSLASTAGNYLQNQAPNNSPYSDWAGGNTLSNNSGFGTNNYNAFSNGSGINYNGTGTYNSGYGFGNSGAT